MTREQGSYNRHCEILIGALTKKLLYNTPIRQTVNECKDIEKFYFYAHVSDKYDGIYLGETPIGLATKVVAGKKGKRLSKRNSRTKTLEKVAGSPEICTRVWGDIDKD